ncbi:hypothetical protein ElyMa_005528500 [Elysia marginata]|uniref:Uncharacterized protein n=1 Tax=Elysia marginata TaxID=1093978 RepID=A0AAV4EVX6_9GAST|nr:hypothetical protein ElyMa_005528500 [Elysia marginata]
MLTLSSLRIPFRLRAAANRRCHQQLFLPPCGLMRDAHWVAHRNVGHGTPLSRVPMKTVARDEKGGLLDDTDHRERDQPRLP